MEIIILDKQKTWSKDSYGTKLANATIQKRTYR